MSLNEVDTTGGGGTKQAYGSIVIEKEILSHYFKAPVTVKLISNSESVNPREEEALASITISPTFNIREYVKNNVLIGSVKEDVTKSNLYETVGIGNAVSPSNAYPLDIAAGGNHLKMDSGGALSFGEVIFDGIRSVNDFTLADNELGLFVINFTTSDDLAATQYTAILSRVGRNTSDDMGGPLIPPIGGIGGSSSGYNYSTFATDSGGYRLECTGDGKIKIYNSNSSEGQQPGCYLRKIIKIMNYKKK